MQQFKEIHMALLIDGDNAQPKLLEAIIEEVSKKGAITIRRIYGDWTSPGMNGWKGLLNSNAIQPVQQFAYTKGKNSTDSTLIIDAMDILHGKLVDAFCIVSSDSDYTRLATRLREAGLFVMGVGEKKTPEAFVRACEQFIYTELLSPAASEEEEGERKKKVKKSSKKKLSTDRKFMKLFKKAYDIARADDDSAYLSTIGQALRRLDPGFDPRTYGEASLSGLANALKDTLEVRREDKGNTVTVRFKD